MSFDHDHDLKSFTFSSKLQKLRNFRLLPFVPQNHKLILNNTYIPQCQVLILNVKNVLFICTPLKFQFKSQDSLFLQVTLKWERLEYASLAMLSFRFQKFIVIFYNYKASPQYQLVSISKCFIKCLTQLCLSQMFIVNLSQQFS